MQFCAISPKYYLSKQVTIRQKDNSGLLQVGSSNYIQFIIHNLDNNFIGLAIFTISYDNIVLTKLFAGIWEHGNMAKN